MKELNIQERIQKRHKLAEVLPLSLPYAINMNISNICNFQCYYCLQSKDTEERKQIFKNKMMSYQDFKKCINHIKESGVKLKNLILAGYGEPLLNKEIVKMISSAKEKNISEQIEIITNGSLLTPEYSEKLVEAKVDRIRISLQGFTEKEYQEVSNIHLDYQKFKKNIQYLYEHKKTTQIYIKIMDSMVEEHGKKEKFYEEYEKICDELAIETLMPLSDLDYKKEKEKFKKSFYGYSLIENKVCTQPFYSCTVDCDGVVFPCCMVPVPIKFKNLKEYSLDKIWNSEEYMEFLITLLNEKAYKKNAACKNCKRYQYMLLDSDRLDGYQEELIKRFKVKNNIPNLK